MASVRAGSACGLIFTLLAILYSPRALAVGESASSVSVGAERFALATQAEPRVELHLSWKSDERIESGLRGLSRRELRVDSFFETGVGGDRSFDLDRALMRFPVSQPSSYFWIGRTHPVEEGGVGLSVETVSALGANWVQNQSNALAPRSSGWIGAGFSGDIEGYSLDVAATPLFLPTFGPRLDLSETDAVSGSRYARLPPRFVNSKRALVAIRYRVETGDIKDVVLQKQAFVGLGKRTSAGNYRLMAWSAPSPDPVTDISDIIRVNSQDANALVTAVPHFPRQNFVAFQYAYPSTASIDSSGIPLVLFESAYETTARDLTLSGSIKPLPFARVGVLQTIPTRSAAIEGESPGLDSANYAQDLVWLELSRFFARERVRGAMRWEQHWTDGRQGAWIRPTLEYFSQKRLSLFAQASLLVGQDGSYFGAWRSLDSVSTGVRYVW